MRYKQSTSILILTLTAALIPAATLTAQQATSYRIVVLDTLGGTGGGANSINNRGWVTGLANLPDDQTAHATLWMNGETRDLGTLGGPNSAVSWPVKNDNGVIVGISETAQIDPLGERFSCATFFGTPLTHHSCQGFVWEGGAMTALKTLGGNNSYATSANNRGQAVGWAENTVHDPTCVPPQVLQFRAVTWSLKTGEVTELPPLPGDTSSAATSINDQGEVGGISGICDRAVGRFSAKHAVIWRNGVPTDIGNLGGVAWNTVAAMNNLGQAAGFLDLPGDQNGGLNAHAFFWSESTGVKDLGTLPGDSISLAFGINDKSQVVGESCGAGGCRAFLWQGGVMTDLNTLVTPGTIHLDFANDINSAGRIAGGGTNTATGATAGFLAIPQGSRE